jgi:hypothetical protein
MAYPGTMELLPGLSHEVRERTAPEAQASIGMLEARGELWTSMVDAFQKQGHTLQEQRHHPSRHAARPPASAPSQPPRPRHPRSPRRRGGHPGHRGARRTLSPVEAVDEIVALKPAQGLQGQGPFAGAEPTPWRPQVSALPPLTPVVPEEPWPQRTGPLCGELRRASWPAGGPSGLDGPRVPALVALEPGA